MEDLKNWLEGFIVYTEQKISTMERVCPDHRNIKWFEGQVHMAKKTIDKINGHSKEQK